MVESKKEKKPKIVVITTALSSYLAADTLGQMHADYPTNVYVLKTIDPVIFPEKFYLDTFEKGIDGIIIASAGTDCPFEGAYNQLARTVENVHKKMKERGWDIKRLRLTSICSVCTHALLREINEMLKYLNSIKDKEEEKNG